MTQKEFETLTGKSVTTSQYGMIERIYMAAENLDKIKFCQEWKKAKFETFETIADMTERIEKQEVAIQQYRHTAEQEREIKDLRIRELQEAKAEAKKWYSMLTDSRIENVQLALALIACGKENAAVEIMGRAAIVGLKATNNIPFNEIDLQLIANTFNNK